MGRTLQGLIRASGYAGVAGQSLRNNVRGAATGASVAAYILEALPNWRSSNYVAGQQYLNGAYLDFLFDMQAADWFYHLRNYNLPTPANLTVHVHGGVDASLQEIETDAEVNPVAGVDSAWDAGINGVRYLDNKVRVQLLGKREYYGQTVTGMYKNWYGNYDQYEIPFGDQMEPWIIEAQTDSAATGSAGYSDVYFQFRYPQDAGAFNPEFQSPQYNVSVQNRQVQRALEFHWSSNSLFNDTLSTEQYVTFNTNDPATGVTNGYVYLRYRVVGTTTWTNYGSGATPTGEVYWEDARYHAPPYNTP